MDLECWRSELWRSPLSREQVGARLIAIAPRIRAQLIRDRRLTYEWGSLGLKVRLERMRVRGSAVRVNGSSTVLINANDPYEVQRYTAAHELGHLLLTPPNLRSDILQPGAEEDLCERFARYLLIPRRGVIDYLGRGAPTPEGILRLCGEYRVNVTPMLHAVGEELRTRHHLLLARWRGHPQRPRDVAFRVEAAAGQRCVFFPRHQRLATLGLVELDAAGGGAAHGAIVRGSDSEVTIELRGLDREPPSAHASAHVRWHAARRGHQQPYLLAVLELDRALGDISAK